MKHHSSSIDREQLQFLKKNSTAEQRMNWLEDAVQFSREVRKGTMKKLEPKR